MKTIWRRINLKKCKILLWKSGFFKTRMWSLGSVLVLFWNLYFVVPPVHGQVAILLWLSHTNVFEWADRAHCCTARNNRLGWNCIQFFPFPPINRLQLKIERGPWVHAGNGGKKVRNDRLSATLKRCKASELKIKTLLPCKEGLVAFRYYLHLL